MSVHGTARFASRDEVRSAGMFGTEVPGETPNGLLVGWWFEDRFDFQPIAYEGDLHQIIVGGTGSGKFTTALAPMLLGSRLESQTVVVVDPKGEIANLVGPFFETPFGRSRTVHVLDPWDQCGTGASEALNVLDEITLENPNYVDDARALADAIIVPSGGENTHWDNAARNFLTAIILYVALSPKENGARDLMRVRELVAMTWAMPKAYSGPKRATLSAIVFELLDSDLAGGAIKHGVSGLLNREDKERSGIISSIDRDTAWIDSPQMKKVLRGASLDMKEAGRGGHKYFIVLPPDYFMTHRAWLRLMVTAFAKAFKRVRAPVGVSRQKQWRHIVIDEFANLGEMNFIVQEVAIARGFDVKYHFAIQDLNQLLAVYKQGWESFINNSFQRFFAIGDMYTAEYVSRMLGTTTAEAVSTSTGATGGRSVSSSESDSLTQTRNSGINSGTSSGTGQTHSTSVSESLGWSQTQSVSPVQRRLRTADEVRLLPAGNEYLFCRGLYPIECWRPPYWAIFASLPGFTLKEVLGTIGRQPKNEAERQYFTEWRGRQALMKPAARADVGQPSATMALPGPPTPGGNGWKWAAIAVIAIAVLAYWFWPQAQRSQVVEQPKITAENRTPAIAESSASRPRIVRTAPDPVKEFPALFAPAPQSAPKQEIAPPTVQAPPPEPPKQTQPVALGPQQPAQTATQRMVANIPRLRLRTTPEDSETCTPQQRGDFRAVGFFPVCGRVMVGGASLGSAKVSFDVRWIEECAGYCRRTAGCAMFSYDPRGSGPRYTCKLFGANPTETLASGWVTMIQ